MSDGARIILADENRDYFIEKFSEYLVWIDASLELTLQDYVRVNLPDMKRPTWWGYGKPYWTYDHTPCPEDVDNYWTSTSRFHWNDSKSYKKRHAEYYHKYQTVLIALMNGDTVDVPAAMYDQVTRKAEPRSWVRYL